jgi:phage terminase large subunit-like protein
MGDLFLAEVRRMREMRARVRLMSPEKRQAMIAEIGDDGAGEWLFGARDDQLPAEDLDWCWLFLGGRGAGKTRAMSAAIHTAVRAGVRRIHLIAPTAADLADVNIEGPAGIMRTNGGDPIPRWLMYKRRLEWPNGAVCVVFSGEEPEQLRGPECELCVIDEIARMRHQSQVFDNAMLGLRLGERPRLLIATTPRPTPFMKKLIKMDGVKIATGSTYDNAAHSTRRFWL